jgi:hypothetical protein
MTKDGRRGERRDQLLKSILLGELPFRIFDVPRFSTLVEAFEE